MKKDFIKGFVLGSLFFSTISFATVAYEAITASFPILINGEVWESDKPTVVIDGSTYLPLKAIGDVLNVKVNWNSDLKQVEIGESPKQDTPKSFQDSRNIISLSNFSFNYSFGMTEVVYDYKQLKDYSMLSYTVTFYNDKEERIGYGTNVAINKVVGETTTESTYIDGDVRNAKYVKVQVDTTL